MKRIIDLNTRDGRLGFVLGERVTPLADATLKDIAITIAKIRTAIAVSAQRAAANSWLYDRSRHCALLELLRDEEARLASMSQKAAA
jgi:hypothetical protein